MKMPAISVLMPVYNAEAFLSEAIESILNQRFVDFEFLIFNDGSTDRSKEIVLSYADSRIRFFDSHVNQGYVKLLNTGIEQAQGKYIARMDADDISHPLRFEMQFRWMEEKNNCVVCGTRFNEIGKTEVFNLPTENEDIKLKMLYITPFCHPSVMLRTKALMENGIRYVHEQIPAEDYELWVQLSQIGEFCNLSECLLQYRIHGNNISLKSRTPEQKIRQKNAQIEYISLFFAKASLEPADIELIYTLFYKESGYEASELFEIGTLLNRIIESKFSFPVETERVHELLAERFYYRCTTSTYIGFKSFTLANRFEYMKPKLIGNIKLLIKSLFKYNVK